MLKAVISRWKKLEWLDTELAGNNARLCEEFLPHEGPLRRLCTIPGVDKTTALVILAELGTDMDQFPSATRVASWAGLCLGNSKKRLQTVNRDARAKAIAICRILVQSGWGSGAHVGLLSGRPFNRIAHRRGFKGGRRGRSPDPDYRVVDQPQWIGISGPRR